MVGSSEDGCTEEPINGLQTDAQESRAPLMRTALGSAGVAAYFALEVIHGLESSFATRGV
jgi:hypothetical protein